MLRRSVFAVCVFLSALPLFPQTSPQYNFVADATGLHVGATAAYGMEVKGDVTLFSNLNLPARTATAGHIRIDGSDFLNVFPQASNIFMGFLAGNATATDSGAVCNIGIGTAALSSLTTGSLNIGVGVGSMMHDENGSLNTAVGYYSLNSNDTGSANTAVGLNAMYHNTSGVDNTATGYRALATETDGHSNTAVGFRALEAATTSENTAIGHTALYALTTGDSNIAIGVGAGAQITTGSNNILIGNTVVGTDAESNTIRIGLGQTRAFVAGINGVTTGQPGTAVMIDSNGQLGTVSSSRRYKFDIHDAGESTDRLMNLRPVTFRYLAQRPAAPLQYGLIAEEVADVYPELVLRDNEGKPQSVLYQFLAPMLLNEVQKQQKTIDELRGALDAVMQRLDALEKR